MTPSLCLDGGTSGYNHGADCYQPWCTMGGNYYAYGQWNANLNDQTGMADWGYNAITNGGNQENLWRTLTEYEWEHIMNYRSGICFAKAIVNDVPGVILLPDGWNEAIYTLNDANLGNAPSTTNVISLEDWTILENNGAVFLPVTGYLSVDMNYDLTTGHYWLADYYSSSEARLIYFNGSTLYQYAGQGPRYYGRAVRLVRDVQ